MEKYPSWIDKYARSIQQAFVGMIPSRWSSLDGFKVREAYQGAFLSRVAELAEAHTRVGTLPKELFKMFSTPSSIRGEILFLALEYWKLKDKKSHRAIARRVFDWLDSILDAGMKEDKWVINKNIVHSLEEIDSILTKTPWFRDDIQTVKNAGKLYASTASIGLALYRDFFTQEAHEVFGPYDASVHFGDDASLIIKHFPKIKPIELWPEVSDFPYEEIKIYQVLKGVHFRCEFVGMHSLYDAPVVPNTIAIAVEIDGRFIEKDEIPKAAEEIAKYVTEYSDLYEKLDLPAAKRKFVEWEAYQFNKVFEAAGMDWRPTKEMLAPILAADIKMGSTLDSFPSLEEFSTSPEYEVYWLKDLYQDK